MMKLPKPLFPEPCGKSSQKPRRKRKGSRVTGVYNALSGEFSDQSHDNDCVDPEGPAHPATEEEPFDALREFVRLAAMPGATVYTSDEDSAELCERLGIEARYAGDEPGEEEADLD
jgi:hypothetical protein